MTLRTMTSFSWSALAALAAMVSAAQPAGAEGVSGYCVYGRGYEVCQDRWGDIPSGLPRIIQAPAPLPENANEHQARERKWLARCRPVIKQDQYGVGRYYYAAPGCEFGKSED